MTDNPVDEDFRLLLRFWGVRGSTPTTGREFAGCGGNTACVELQLPSGETIIFDAGTGVRRLGSCLAREGRTGASEKGAPLKFFLTHFHWDHIQGIPFFAPLFAPGNHLVFHSWCEPEELRELLARQMSTPYFPVDFGALRNRIDFVKVSKENEAAAGVLVRPFPMNHPQGAYGYRVEHKGAVVVYASDLEHGHAELDKVVREFSREADVLIFDAQYTPEEYESRRGWGHSTWMEATRVARDAGVKKLLLIHHDPEHDDRKIEEMIDLARGEFEHTDAAREGALVRI